jgi:hypothetical protein
MAQENEPVLTEHLLEATYNILSCNYLQEHKHQYKSKVMEEDYDIIYLQ